MRTALPLRPFVTGKHHPIIVVFLFMFLLWSVPLAKADTNVGGTIATDTAWTLAQSPYIVTSNITVKGTDGADGITTLTIEPGVEVRMTKYRQFIVGGSSGDPGALAAQGTAADPILFTSNEASPAVGDWYYIKLDSTSDDAGTVLEHCVVEYAGGSQGAIYLSNASPTIVDTTIRLSKNAGIYATNSSFSLTNCTLSDNNGYGIYLSGGSPALAGCTFANSGDFDLYYTGTVGGTVSGCTINNGIYVYSGVLGAITGNTINYNAGYPIRIGADGVGELLAQNTLNNLDSDSLIEVTADTIERDAAWSAAVKYLILGNLTVKGTDGADNITTLTLEPGAELRMTKFRQFIVGAASGDPGALVAQGTAANPILFTSNEASPAVGDWYYIKFDNTSDDAGTVLEHCVVEYAGGSQGAIVLYNASPTIADTTIRLSKNAGIHATNSSFSLTNCTLSDNNGYGIYLSGGSSALAGCTFTNSGNFDLYYNGTVGDTLSGCTINNGIYVYSGVLGAITGNTINDNAGYPIRIGADGVGELLAQNTLNNLDSNSLIEVTGDTIERDATWSAAVKYLILGNLTVKGTDGADSITTLTLEPGVELRMTRYRQFIVGAASGDPGALAAQGTATDSILFTSNEASPAVGDWYYIKLDNTSDDASTVLEHCVVEYAGGSQAALYLDNASPTIQNTTVRFSKNAGIYGSGSGCATADINCNTFSNNKTGIYWMVSPTPEMHSNNFSGNTDYGIYYSGSATLNAENNWWGDAAGPNTGGDATYGNVDADPWSTAENQCSAGGENHAPNEPNTPEPADQAVRVSSGNGVTLRWSGDDPDPLDTVTYDLHWGTDPQSLALTAQDIAAPEYTVTALNPGVTYLWQIIARDNQGLETSGPVWCFTTDGDPPDLIVAQLATDPGGNLQSGQGVTFIATVQNSGSGPAVDPFSVDFTVAGVSLGSVAVDQILLAGQSLQVSQSWTYAGGNPAIEVIADVQAQVSETDETNNSFSVALMAIADNDPPTLTGSSPADGSYLQQIQQITATLADSLGTVDDSLVMAGFAVTGSGQHSVAGTLSESDDTFTFVPDSLPLADDIYQVNLTAADTYGNTQNISFSFTIDTQPPAKPVITGGTVDSGTIQPRPAQNASGQFVVELTGTRDAGTSVWVDNAEIALVGDADWAVQLTLMPGTNSLEIWLKDAAGNQGASEWVDIDIQTGTTIQLDYNAAGRTKRIHNGQ